MANLKSVKKIIELLKTGDGFTQTALGFAMVSEQTAGPKGHKPRSSMKCVKDSLAFLKDLGHVEEKNNRSGRVEYRWLGVNHPDEAGTNLFFGKTKTKELEDEGKPLVPVQPAYVGPISPALEILEPENVVAVAKIAQRLTDKQNVFDFFRVVGAAELEGFSEEDVFLMCQYGVQEKQLLKRPGNEYQIVFKHERKAKG